jgi:hypothetical protein
MQKAPRRIRRCRNCGFKTHQRFWEDEKCPICKSNLGYSLSAHGGLIEKEIEKQRNVLSSIQKCQK